MVNKQLDTIVSAISQGTVVPYLGPGALQGAYDLETEEAIPADSDSLILAMNNGQPMAPKLMYEFPRAAMNLELKKGRSYITRFLTTLYGERQWSIAPLHQWLAQIRPAYVIDTNRDITLQATYIDTPHNLIVGTARLGGSDYRYRLYHFDGIRYSEIEQQAADPQLPLLFKPMGTPLPAPSYIASDADYVDYITELMGGFAVPDFLKSYRQGKQYLFIGMRMTRDTERMVMSDITFAADSNKGWALIPEPTAKEKRFCNKQGIEIIEAGIDELLAATSTRDAA